MMNNKVFSSNLNLHSGTTYHPIHHYPSYQIKMKSTARWKHAKHRALKDRGSLTIIDLCPRKHSQ